MDTGYYWDWTLNSRNRTGHLTLKCTVDDLIGMYFRHSSTIIVILLWLDVHLLLVATILYSFVCCRLFKLHISNSHLQLNWIQALPEGHLMAISIRLSISNLGNILPEGGGDLLWLSLVSIHVTQCRTFCQLLICVFVIACGEAGSIHHLPELTSDVDVVTLSYCKSVVIVSKPSW